MKLRATLLAAMAAMLFSAAADAQSRRDPPPASTNSSLFGIDGPQRKASDGRNGRKRVIYDRNGRRDYRRDFAPNLKDQTKRLECQLRPADNSCIGFRF